MKFDLISYLMNPRHWWRPLLLILIISIAGVTMIGKQTYTDAPPVASFVDINGRVIFSKEQIQLGQELFHKYSLMEYGSMFGDGAYRGPDFTAESLHMIERYMEEYYLSNEDIDPYSAAELVKHQIKENYFDAVTNSIKLLPAQVYAAEQLINYYQAKSLPQSDTEPFNPLQKLKSAKELKSLVSFFYWGGWVCGTSRPGKNYSYTHNWPYDPAAGNTPSGAVILWTLIGSFALILVLGIVLFFYGRMDKLDDKVYVKNTTPFMSHHGVLKYTP
ncbi:MAG TPA: hypothetical protein VFV08_16780, partial [Puia sp.]|nr:hypothetical protein [Puia sp.]